VAGWTILKPGTLKGDKEETMENIFDKIKSNLKKGMEEGIAVLREGATVVSVRMNELSEEGKRQYKIFNLNLKIQEQIKELGCMAYAALDKGKRLDDDKKIKAAYSKIKKIEWQLTKTEGQKKVKTPSAGKTAAKSGAKRAKASPKKAKPQSAKAAGKSAAPGTGPKATSG
jgi:hypothetical protein